MKKFIHVAADDWEGLYVDGKLVAQGHSLSLETWFRHLEVDVDSYGLDWDWMHRVGTLPANFEECEIDSEDEYWEHA